MLLNKKISVLHRSHRPWGRCLAFALATFATLAWPGTVDAQDLAPFLDQFSTVSSVHLEAEVAIMIETPDGPLFGTGAFSFWEQGDLFKIRSETEGIEGLMHDVEWAYNGEESLLWLLEPNTLTENISLTLEAPTALPNPFFLPVEFLSRRHTCPTCRTSLNEIVQERPLLTELQRRQVAVGKSTSGTPGEARTTLVLAKSETGPRYAVSLAQSQGLWTPATIRHTRSDTGEEMLIQLSDYQRAPALVFPRSIQVETKDPSTRASAQVTFRITTLEVNDSLPLATFGIQGNKDTNIMRMQEVQQLEEQLKR